MGEKKRISLYMLTCCFLILVGPVLSYAGEIHSRELTAGKTAVSVFYNSSEIDYKIKDLGDLKFTRERTMVGLSSSWAINEKLSLFGTFSYLLDGSLDFDGSLVNRYRNEPLKYDLDDGYQLSAGVRCLAFQKDKLSVHLYGKLDYLLEEKYSSNTTSDGRSLRNGSKAECAMDGFEVTVGGDVKYKLTDQLSAYAGASYVPFSSLDFELILESNWETVHEGQVDVEQSDKLGFKLGGQFDISPTWSIGGEARFNAESAYVVNVGAKF